MSVERCSLGTGHLALAAGFKQGICSPLDPSCRKLLADLADAWSWVISQVPRLLFKGSVSHVEFVLWLCQGGTLTVLGVRCLRGGAHWLCGWGPCIAGG